MCKKRDNSKKEKIRKKTKFHGSELSPRLPRAPSFRRRVIAWAMLPPSLFPVIDSGD